MSGGNHFLARILVSAAAAAGLFPPAAFAGSDAIANGIVMANAAWEEPGAVSATFSDIASAGFASVRIGLKNPLAHTFRAIDSAHENGLGILVTVPLVDGSVARENARPREPQGRSFMVYGLSEVDIRRYRHRLDALLRFCARRKIPLLGIELGNELNWSGYNGDLRQGGSGKVISDGGGWAGDERLRFNAGLDTYLAIVQETRRALAAYPALSTTSIVSAGLADANAEFVGHAGATLVASGVVYQGFGARGILDYVDVVGIHLYEPLRLARTGSDRKGLIEDALAGCGRSALSGKPCWITEFGTALPPQECAHADTSRIKAVGSLIDFLSAPGNAKRVTAAYFYDWNQDAAFALQRCGRLTALSGFMLRSPRPDEPATAGNAMAPVD